MTTYYFFFTPDKIQIEDRGGKCIPVQCDHGNDDEVKKFFEKVEKEQNGRLDIFVNNAFSAGPVSSKNGSVSMGKF